MAASCVVAAFACGGNTPTAPKVPTTTADIAGRVTFIAASGNYAGSIRVEAIPTSPTTGAKALVTVVNATNIFLIDRKEGDFRAFSSGQWVRVWFNGPVALSYPVQGTAATIAIDSAGVGITP
jgi:hypothetical protein